MIISRATQDERPKELTSPEILSKNHTNITHRLSFATQAMETMILRKPSKITRQALHPNASNGKYYSYNCTVGGFGCHVSVETLAEIHDKLVILAVRPFFHQARESDSCRVSAETLGQQL